MIVLIKRGGVLLAAADPRLSTLLNETLLKFNLIDNSTDLARQLKI